ncbi:MAG: polyprenyl synthetase family protein [Candidatus Saccharimonadaceae bacterium]
MNPSISIMDLTSTKALTDKHIKRYCEERKTNARQISPRYVALWDSIETLLLAGGKRLRPHLLITAYMAYAKEVELEDILPAAVAQELLHSAMLIHDDIIDRDVMRYGTDNIQGQYNTSYAPFIHDEQERAHMSLSASLLAGDILLSDAHRILRSINFPAELVNQATEILSRGVFEVIGGELLDTEVSFLPKGLINAETIAKFKTASYSFTSPLTMGATLAGVSEAELYLLTKLSENLGIGYQLRDDILGVFGDEDKTGKSSANDIIEGKRTFLIEQFEAIASPQQTKRFFEIFHHSEPSENDLEEARSLLIEAGAKEHVERRIVTLHEAATALINQLSIDEAAKQELQSIAKHCLQREA